MATGDRGLTEFTVKEATNLIAQRKVIRVTPTLSTDAYTAQDVLIMSTEIPNAVLSPGGCSLLQSISILNHKNTAIDMHVVFQQTNVDPSSAINEPVANSSTWTKALSSSANVLGWVEVDWSDGLTDLINNQLFQIEAMTDLSNPSPLMYLQADKGSTSAYFWAIDKTGGITFAADDLDFIFHIEY